MLKFMDVFGRWEAAELNQVETAELLSVGERTFRRWCRRYEEDCEVGLLDRLIGKAPGRRVPVDRCEEVEHLYRARYQCFIARHFHEHLVRAPATVAEPLHGVESAASMQCSQDDQAGESVSR